MIDNPFKATITVLKDKVAAKQKEIEVMLSLIREFEGDATINSASLNAIPGQLLTQPTLFQSESNTQAAPARGFTRS